MKKGDKIRCINDESRPESFMNWIEKDKVYTVRYAEELNEDGMRILLDEVINPEAYFPELNENHEPGFSNKRFELEEETASTPDTVDMSKYLHKYTHITVESFEPIDTSGRHGKIHIRPVKDEVFDQDLFVECSKRLSKDYPVGTRFQIKAKLSRREDGAYYIYSHYSWPYEVIE